MKKRWLFIPLAVGLLALVITSSAILAQGSAHPGGVGHRLASRVAEILDLDEETVQSAFNQAMREHQNEHVDNMLDRLVATERLTSDEAEVFMQWYLSRPDAAVYLRGVLLWGEDALQRRLGRMVDAGIVSEDEAGEVTTWYELRPEGFPPAGAYSRGGPERRFHKGPARGDNTANDTRAFRRAPWSASSVTAPVIFH